MSACDSSVAGGTPLPRPVADRPTEEVFGNAKRWCDGPGDRSWYCNRPSSTAHEIARSDGIERGQTCILPIPLVKLGGMARTLAVA